MWGMKNDLLGEKRIKKNFNMSHIFELFKYAVLNIIYDKQFITTHISFIYSSKYIYLAKSNIFY